MTKERCLSLLDVMGDIALIRYIVLINRSIVTNNSLKLTNYKMSIYNFCRDQNFGLKSKLVTSVIATKLVSLGNIILRSLIENSPDSQLGISIVADAPECNNAMLNVKRPGVLRQYYGRDISWNNSLSMIRVAYRSNVSFKSEGSDPYKLIIKPFPREMEDMASYIYNFILENQNELDRHDVDVTNEFNSCTILLYHALDGFKSQSSMGWHCDNKFTLNGNFPKLAMVSYITPQL